MSIPKKVLKHLAKAGVSYDILKHKTVYTTFDLAQTIKEKLDKIAKTLLVKADKKYVLVVLPAHYKLDLSKLKKVLKAKAVAIAPEKIMTKVLKTKVGALTPFGSLHKVDVVLDSAFAKAQRVLLRAGSYTESIAMKMRDYAKMENPIKGAVGKLEKKYLKKK